jgi:hypothetical protein
MRQQDGLLDRSAAQAQPHPQVPARPLQRPVPPLKDRVKWIARLGVKRMTRQRRIKLETKMLGQRFEELDL